MSVEVRSGSLVNASIANSSVAPVIRLASVVLAVLLTAAAAQVTVPLPFTPVPLVFTPLAVLVCAAAVGSRLGAMAQVVYVLAGVAGVQVFAPSATLPPGALRLFGPTGGYLMAYPLAAYVTGYLAVRRFDRRYLTSVIAMLVGLAIVFAGGVAWLSLQVGVGAALAAGFYPFVVADAMKVAAAAGIMPGIWKRVDVARQL